MPDETLLADLLEGMQESDDPAAFLATAKREHPDLADALDRHAEILALVDAVVRKETTGVPARIGPYRILDFVARGGMGSVYLAQQEEPFQRQVALKILSRHVDTPEARARFDLEREALSRMDHPNIARVFDAGPLPDGRPYVVMEYVDGPPITDYCEQSSLGLEDRLRLFAAVCDAVGYAHQKGVIHRDVKPSNVLVSEVDGRPVPKVIDFGLAKPVAAEDVVEDVTLRGQVIGTPAYMSPEQARGEQAVDVRTDVYALGVLLYELLVGDVPWGRESLSRLGAAAVIRRILEEDPPRPSTRLSTLASAPEGAAGSDAGPSHPWARRLRGDLDWITMRALAKEPERRYGTARELADDVRRHLRHEPVEAGPPSATYRVRKFVRRHGAAVTAAVGILLALVAGLVVSVLLYRDAERARRDAEIATTREREARHEAELAEASAARSLVEKQQEARKALVARDFLREMFAEIRPSYHGAGARLLDVLTPAGKRLAAALPDDPETQAGLHEILGSTHLQFGVQAQVVFHLDRAVALRTDTLGPAHPDTLDVRILRAIACARGGETRRAQAELFEVQRALDAGNGATPERALRLLEALADLRSRQGRHEEALPLFQEVIAELEKLGPGVRFRALPARHGLAVALRAEGRIEEASHLLEEIAAYAPELLGAEDPRLYAIQLDWLRLLNDRGDHPQAADLARSILANVQRLAGPGHPDALAALGELHRSLSSQGADEAARSVELRLARLSGGQPLAAGDVTHAPGTGEEASAPSAEPPLDPETAELRRHGESLAGAGDLTGALEVYDVVLERMLEESFRTGSGPTRQDLTDLLYKMARIAQVLGDPERSAALLEARVLQLRLLADAHPDERSYRVELAETLAEWATRLSQLDRHAAALRRVRESRALYDDLVGPLLHGEEVQLRTLRAEARSREAGIHRANASWTEACEEGLAAVSQFDQLLAKEDLLAAVQGAAGFANLQLANTMSHLGRTEEEVRYYQRGIDLMLALRAGEGWRRPETHLRVVSAMLRLAELRNNVSLDHSETAALRRDARAFLAEVRDVTSDRDQWQHLFRRAHVFLDVPPPGSSTQEHVDRAAEALAEWEAVPAADRGPRHAAWGGDLLSSLGSILLNLGRMDEARAVFERGIQLHEVMEREPAYDQIARRQNLARLWTQVGRSRLAEHMARGPFSPEPSVALEALNRAIDILEPLLTETTERSPEVRNQLAIALSKRGDAYLEIGRHLEAARDAGKAVKLGRISLAEDPQDRSALLVLSLATSTGAVTCERAGDLAAALRAHEEAAAIDESFLDLTPGDANCHLNLIQDHVALLRVSALLGRREDAQRWLDRALARWATAWNRLSDMETARFRLVSAIERLFDEALRCRLGLAPIVRLAELAVPALESRLDESAEDVDARRALSMALFVVTVGRDELDGAAENVDSCRRAIEVIRPLMEADEVDAEVLRRAYLTYVMLGNAFAARADRGRATEANSRALALMESMKTLRPSEVLTNNITSEQGKLSENLRLHARQLYGEFRFGEALEVARRSLEISESLYARGRSGAMAYELKCYQKRLLMAGCMKGLGDPAQQLILLRSALACLDRAQAMSSDPSLGLAVVSPGLKEVYEEALGIRELMDREVRTLEAGVGIRPAVSFGEHVRRARVLTLEGEEAEALQHLELLLEDSALAAEAGPYDRACAAALAIPITDGDVSRRYREQALIWLQEALESKRSDAAKLEASSTSPSELQQARSHLTRYLDWVRMGDPDLASLRGTPAFEALFAKANHEK